MEEERKIEKEQLAKYISALFRAEEAFRKELEDYDEGKDKDRSVEKMLAGLVSNQLPLKYRIAMKLPWNYAVDALSGFLKELGEGSVAEVLASAAKSYMSFKGDEIIAKVVELVKA